MTSVRRYLPAVSRIFLGLVFTVFGLNGFFHFLSMPAPPARAGALAGAMFQSGYLMQLVFVTELAVGLLLLTKRLVPLALVLIAPVIVNIVAFHLFLAPGGLGLAGAVLAAELTLAWTHREAYAPIFRTNAQTSADATAHGHTPAHAAS
jgi:hypothetical protein